MLTFRDNLSVSSSKVKMEPIGCPETSVRNHHYSLCNNPEDHSSHLLSGGSLKSHLRVPCLPFSLYVLFLISLKSSEKFQLRIAWLNSIAGSSMLCYEGRTESHEQHFLHANWEQQTKENAVVDGISCCVILECLVTSIACIT